MKSRAPGTECRIYVDGMPTLQPGHYITTPAGSAYFVQTMRQNRNRPQRRHLVCIRTVLAEIPADAVRHVLHWYKRPAKRVTR